MPDQMEKILGRVIKESLSKEAESIPVPAIEPAWAELQRTLARRRRRRFLPAIGSVAALLLVLGSTIWIYPALHPVPLPQSDMGTQVGNSYRPRVSKSDDPVVAKPSTKAPFRQTGQSEQSGQPEQANQSDQSEPAASDTLRDSQKPSGSPKPAGGTNNQADSGPSQRSEAQPGATRAGTDQSDSDKTFKTQRIPQSAGVLGRGSGGAGGKGETPSLVEAQQLTPFQLPAEELAPGNLKLNAVTVERQPSDQALAALDYDNGDKFAHLEITNGPAVEIRTAPDPADKNARKVTVGAAPARILTRDGIIRLSWEIEDLRLELLTNLSEEQALELARSLPVKRLLQPPAELHQSP